MPSSSSLEGGALTTTRRRAGAAACVAVLAAGLAACGGGGGKAASARGTTTGGAPASTAPPGGSADCPAGYLPPDPRRPVVTLSFDLAADHARVTGREHVVFTPDQPVRELVFRLWPNSPENDRTGAELRVTRASALGSDRFTVAPAGGRADTPGTLLTLPLPRTVPAGEAVTADLDFTLTLPPARSDRLGHTATTAWWASSHPLLAWQRGRGWVREPAVPLEGETAVSEAARLDLTVTAPAADTVLTTGTADPPVAVDGGRRRWHSTASAARDVSVAVAPFRLATGRAGGVPVTVGTAPEVAQPPQTVLAEATRAVTALAARFGPYPFEALTLAAVPGIGDSGIEYPGAILLGDTPTYRIVVAHEVAHQWFYGLVGDDQARDPWLDEGFATYAEALVNRDEATYLPLLSAPDPVDLPMSAFGVDTGRYVITVYGKGAAALLTARRRAGPAAFDAALRCYVARNAWRVVAPADVATALAALPPALAVLRRAGALRDTTSRGPTPQAGSGLRSPLDARTRPGRARRPPGEGRTPTYRSPPATAAARHPAPPPACRAARCSAPAYCCQPIRPDASTSSQTPVNSDRAWDRLWARKPGIRTVTRGGRVLMGGDVLRRQLPGGGAPMSLGTASARTPLQAARFANGWSQRELMRRLRHAAAADGRELPGGTSLQSQVSSWETGRVTPSAFYQRLLCRTYDTAPAELGFVHAVGPLVPTGNQHDEDEEATSGSTASTTLLGEDRWTPDSTNELAELLGAEQPPPVTAVTASRLAHESRVGSS